jgi:hypothetical protein
MLLLTYIVCAAFGATLLGISLFSSGDGHDGHDEASWSWFSIRSLIHFLAFFGATGLALQLFADAHLIVSLAASSFVGVCAATMASVVSKRLLGENAAGSGTTTAADLIGKEAVVLTSFQPQETGRIRLQSLTGTVDMLSESTDGTAFEDGECVLVVDVKQGIASVTKLKREEKS